MDKRKLKIAAGMASEAMANFSLGFMNLHHGLDNLWDAFDLGDVEEGKENKEEKPKEKPTTEKKAKKGAKEKAQVPLVETPKEDEFETVKEEPKTEAGENYFDMVDDVPNADDFDFDGDETPSEPQKTIEDVRSALVALAKRKDKAAGYEILKKYGATKIDQLDVKNYSLVIKECESK